MPLAIPEIHGARDLALLVAASGVFPLAVLPFATGVATTLPAARLALAPGPPDEHWTARARRVAPARTVAMLATGFAVGVSAALASLQVGALFPRPEAAGALAAAGAAWLGGSAASWLVLNRYAAKPAGFFAYARNQAAFLAVVLPHLALLVALGATLYSLESLRAPLAIAGVVLWIGLSIVGGVPVARLLRRIHPASPKLAAAVARAAAKTGRAPRSVEELELPIANAFALPTIQAIYFTRHAVEALTEDEIEAVAAHELGHLGEPRAVVRARVAAGLALLPVAFLPVTAEWLGWLGALAATCAVLAAIVLPMRRLQQRMEVRADRVAACADAGSASLARGLERIYALNLLPAVGARDGIHPDLYDRMLASGIEPDFPRPHGPSQIRFLVGTCAAAAGLLCMGLVNVRPESSLALVIADPAARGEIAIALSGGAYRDLFELAHSYGEERPGDALATAALLADARPDDADSQALHAWTLALNGRCADAADALMRAAGREIGDVEITVAANEALVRCTRSAGSGSERQR
jgi:Zn-dependent protease with chaperone function